MRYLSENQFEVYEEIGKGGFGTVYKGLDKVTKQPVAIKQVDLESTDDIDSLQKEIRILSQCKLSQITQYHGCFVKGYKLWIIMELLDGGSCSDMLVAGPLKEKYIAVLLKEVLIALDYLHNNGKIHRDIKAANILLNCKGEVKVADFGVSTQLSNNLSRRNTFVGSPYWMSPEVILEEEYNSKADIWSLGITAIELVTGKPPLHNIHPMKAIFKIPELDPPILKGNEYSNEFKQFIELCLQKSSQNRPSAKRLLKSKFIQNAGKNYIVGDLIKRRHVWDIQHGGDKVKKTQYVPTIEDKQNLQQNTVIQFDFESDDDDSMNDSMAKSMNTSNVVITKNSPLGYQGNSVLKRNIGALKQNDNILNTNSSKLSNESNFSTIKYRRQDDSSISKPGEEVVNVFKSTVSKLETKVDLPSNQLNKLNQISSLLSELSEENDDLVFNVYKQFQSKASRSETIQTRLGYNNAMNSQQNQQHSQHQKPRKSESEKLLLKRWADQYFA
ncbi:Calcium-dependent protein kinase 9 [Wickerhamomyces ciferrii]|uniref:non-specific serine/threonine protein kinase n=1 Tax=Wickerhamomyces ciferrii (strain ATCC 14091 / BCRC 22168 / CBS 111 / JCM 3599 / NBRC 0793 / NRRL Y-1031 F-60-10) TaxID=1206466 RepID=K0KH39_WICCF|nr:Calcium-dependent protein kinase 9 [Wickerhamomyces ciferrii]CCH42286.1 Calcium-dependent protein kinase 9 [Wickerhamomyces ciferrii]